MGKGFSSSSEVKAAANGRWRYLLTALGVDDAFLTGKHGPCPMCGGKDRWRYTDYQGNGDGYCNQCGHVDGFDLLMGVNQWGFREAREAVGDVLPQANFKPKHQNCDRDKARKALNKLREEAIPAGDSGPVKAYLAGRGLEVPPGLEAHRELPYYEDGVETGRYPVMLGRVVAKSGNPVTYHRTYIDGDRKASVRAPRKMMRTARGTKGWAIRLYPAESEVVIAEGIETAIACKLLFGIPAWSVVSANGMLDWEPPEGIERVIVAGDNDASLTGQAAAYEKARRLWVLGYSVEVRIPPEEGDWNDVLLNQKGAA